MSNEVKVDRATAAKINPLISDIGTEDTLDSLSSVVYEFGFLIVEERDLATGHLFHLFSTIAAALAWEVGNISSAKCRRGECGASRHE